MFIETKGYVVMDKKELSFLFCEYDGEEDYCEFDDDIHGATVFETREEAIKHMPVGTDCEIVRYEETIFLSGYKEDQIKFEESTATVDIFKNQVKLGDNPITHHNMPTYYGEKGEITE